MAITLAVYVPAVRGGFVWDDYGFFIDNPLIENPHGLHDIWLTTEPQDYFALTSTMLWAEWQAWGMNPIGYHVVNILLHAGASAMVAPRPCVAVWVAVDLKYTRKSEMYPGTAVSGWFTSPP